MVNEEWLKELIGRPMKSVMVEGIARQAKYLIGINIYLIGVNILKAYCFFK